MTPNTPAGAALSLAGIWGAQVFGMPVSVIVIATCITILGALGRLGFEISNGASRGNIGALFGGSMTSAVTIAVLYLAVLKSIGIQSDSVSIIGLLFFGFIGPKALLWLFNVATTTISKKTGLQLPQVGPKADGQP